MEPTNRAPAGTFDAVARWLHWLAAGIIVAAWAFMETKDLFPKGGEGRRMLGWLHFNSGMVVLLLLAARWPWQLLHPVAPLDTRPWPRRLAGATKSVLYLLMLLVPLSGLAALMARPEGTTVLGYTLADPVPALAAWRKPLKEAHEVLSNSLLVLAGVHAAAAVWHHVVLGDATLRRMLGGR